MHVSFLVLTDFNPAAQRALSYANTLAGSSNAQLVLLYVQRDSLLDPEFFIARHAQQSEPDIKAAFDRATRDLTAHVVTRTRHGQVADVVSAELAHHPASLIVLGRPDEQSTPDELISTTALDLLRANSQPMLVVPYNAITPAPPRRILFAIDAEPFTLSESNDVIRHLFGALHAQLTVLHVSSGADEAVPARVFDSVTRSSLFAHLEPLKTAHSVNPDTAAGILHAAAAGHFDLIVLVARPRSFLGELFHHSVTAEVLLHSSLPVLVLPAE